MGCEGRSLRGAAALCDLWLELTTNTIPLFLVSCVVLTAGPQHGQAKQTSAIPYECGKGKLTKALIPI